MTDTNQCSFCGRPSTEAGLLVSGLDAQICANCIEQAHHILEEESDDADSSALGSMDLPKPSEIRARLDEYVIGQEDAKKSSP
jgi:ATP-dependent Clp protease ATP-binding subunit ClpX